MWVPRNKGKGMRNAASKRQRKRLTWMQRSHMKVGVETQERQHLREIPEREEKPKADKHSQKEKAKMGAGGDIGTRPCRTRTGSSLVDSWNLQVSMSADANFPVAPKWIRMNFP